MNKHPSLNKHEWARNLILLVSLLMLGFVAAIHLQALAIFIVGWLLGASFMSASLRAQATDPK